MSKFYTFDELMEEIPTAKAVTSARDAALQFIEGLGVDRERVVMFGSAMWGVHRKIEEQSGRRSDIDIALTEGGSFSGRHDLVEKVQTFRSELESVTNVPIALSVFELGAQYECFISPSTADHFRLLANKFRAMHHSRFLGLIRDSQKKRTDRAEDLEDYIRAVQKNTFEFLYQNKDCLNLREPETLRCLSKLENFPDHIIRKLLGREQILPCPDSKQNIRKIFSSYAPKWAIRDSLLPAFGRMFSHSLEYEVLIDSVDRGMKEEAYYQNLDGIAKNMIATGKDIFNGLGCIYGSINQISSAINIVRIPRGTPVIVLCHYRDGKGDIKVEILESDFGSPDHVICYPLGYAIRPIFATRGKKLISRYEKTDLLTYSIDRAECIQDPKTPEGWIKYKTKGYSERMLCSIKPCDQEFLTKFKQETNKEAVHHATCARIKKEYYRQFAKEAFA